MEENTKRVPQTKHIAAVNINPHARFFVCGGQTCAKYPNDLSLIHFQAAKIKPITVNATTL